MSTDLAVEDTQMSPLAAHVYGLLRGRSGGAVPHSASGLTSVPPGRQWWADASALVGAEARAVASRPVGGA